MQQNFIFRIYPVLKDLAQEGVDFQINQAGEIQLSGFFKHECVLKLVYDDSTTPETKKIIARYREGKSKNIEEIEINSIEDLARLNFLAWTSSPEKNSPTGFPEPEKGWEKIFTKRRWVKSLRLSIPDVKAFESSFEKDKPVETIVPEASVATPQKIEEETDFTL